MNADISQKFSKGRIDSPEGRIWISQNLFNRCANNQKNHTLCLGVMSENNSVKREETVCFKVRLCSDLTDKRVGDILSASDQNTDTKKIDDWTETQRIEPPGYQRSQMTKLTWN